jgi:hypothetical protein
MSARALAVSRRKALLWALAGLGPSVWPGLAAAHDQDKERAEPPAEVPPLVWRGVRYDAPRFTRTLGLAHNGGYVRAIDLKTGQPRWMVEVFEPLPDDGKEADKREVFITHLRLSKDRRHLLVTDERRRRARVRLDTGAVQRLDAPA